MKKNLVKAVLVLTCTLVMNGVFSMDEITFRYPPHAREAAKKELIKRIGKDEYEEIGQFFSQENMAWFWEKEYLTRDQARSISSSLSDMKFSNKTLGEFQCLKDPYSSLLIHAFGKFIIEEAFYYTCFKDMAKSLDLESIIGKIKETAEKQIISLIGESEYKQIQKCLDFIENFRSIFIEDIFKRVSLSESTLDKLGVVITYPNGRYNPPKYKLPEKKEEKDNLKTLMRALEFSKWREWKKKEWVEWVRECSTPNDLFRNLGITPDQAEVLGFVASDQMLTFLRAQLKENQRAVETERQQLQQKFQKVEGRLANIDQKQKETDQEKDLFEAEKQQLQQRSKELRDWSTKIDQEQKETAKVREDINEALQEKEREKQSLHANLIQAKKKAEQKAEELRQAQAEKLEFQKKLRKAEEKRRRLKQNAQQALSEFKGALPRVLSEKIDPLFFEFQRRSHQATEISATNEIGELEE